MSKWLALTSGSAYGAFSLGLWLFLQTVVAVPSELLIGGFFPVSKKVPEGEIGLGVIPAVTLALEHINSSPNVLPGYHLTLEWNDTQCDPAVGMKSFFDMLSKEKFKVALFGDACTAVTDPIAKASQFFQLVQLTYGDTHPMYTVENYPNFFRVVPSEAAFNQARVALLQHFNWTRVGTLYQSAPRYALPHSKLLTDLEAANIEIAAQQGFVDEVKSAVSKLKEKDVRIILGYFEEHWARNVFCEAYKMGLYGRKYQWIIVGMYDDSWWLKYGKNLTCNQSHLKEAIKGYIAIDILPLSSTNNITVSGLTSAEYNAQYKQRYRKGNNRFHGYAYDGIWVIALAIQMVKRKLLSIGSSKTLEMFEYRDPFWGTIFREAFNKTSFIGVTGPVRFVRNERRGLILLKQYQNGDEVKVGEYDSTSNSLKLTDENGIRWNGADIPPVDRTLIVIRPTRVNLTIYYVIVIFALMGILMASAFLIVNIRFRNQRYIKMSSPYLNNIIIIGCMLTYTSVILLGLDSGLTSEKNFPYICAARAWVLMNGFTLAFGSMFSKTWRVHAIFTNIKLNKKVIKDYKLFMVVGVLVVVDIIILTTWQIIDPFYRETSLGAQLPSPENEDSVIIPKMEFCKSQKMTVFLGSIYAYKGLLMAFGCFLAWETRHVSIPALNDSKYIGMSVYNVVIMCVIGAAVSFVLREQQDAAFIIISIFIIFCSTTTLCLVFVPKLFELKRNTNAGDRCVRATLKPLKKTRKYSEDVELHCQINMLHDENYHYRQRLEEKNVELQTLMNRLKEVDEPLIIVSHGITSPIPENSSSTGDGNCEEIQVPVFWQNRGITTISRSPSLAEEEFDEPFEKQHSVRKLSLVSLNVVVAHTSLPDSSTNIRNGYSPNTKVPTLEFQESLQMDSCSLSHLSPLSFVDQVIRFMDSESSSESVSSHGHILHHFKDTPMVSDNKDVKNYQKVQNDLSAVGRDTDRVEESDTSRPGTRNILQRAKSLGTLELNTASRNNARTEGVRVIQENQADSPTLSPLIPFSNNLVTNQMRRRTGTRDVNVPLYSSFPSIKCDIIEYL
ncbi:gamma-aminobutyric acid type B receptor subunit 2-like [Tachypleus tridentatus]|uniref:gamma-aminobutyric acid type B receptor subunit 2-like n=1 Tax=Tachypleus tridentatus TaxID=6853 RepID=UPI003FD091FB